MPKVRQPVRAELGFEVVNYSDSIDHALASNSPALLFSEATIIVLTSGVCMTSVRLESPKKQSLLLFIYFFVIDNITKVTGSSQ